MAETRNEELSPVKRALLELRDLRARLDELEGQASEPIAIIGAGLRFPGGAQDVESYWQLLCNGVDAIVEVPPARWDINALYDPDPMKPGKMSVRCGGFVSQIDQFDPQFFGISPREAVSMDPQQRLLLEVAWEALENAGQSPDSLFGSQSGVFLGISNSDYFRLMLRDIEQIDTYSTTGSALSVAGGRLSYVLGLQGPNISIDTACSASLVAVHLAVHSLRLRESSLAIAGGVSLMLTPDITVNFSKAQMMSPDGRCKTFDARADGYVRGEGCGVVVLKRLSDALADGDSIMAVIRGSAINQDGRSGGLTAPNGPSQENVITAALANAGLNPADVGYVEAHGTGTSLGDPIEVQALGAALGKARQSPLMIGSVKTNMGHLEAAAGVAGLIKAALIVQRGEIPPHLHLTEPNPFIPWAQLPITVPTQRTPWVVEGGKRIAGVSSFGFSGTNAHVILEEPPAIEPAAAESERPAHVLALSARSGAALSELAARYATYLADHPNASFADVCYTAANGRAHFSHRLAVVAEAGEQAREKLIAWANGEQPLGVVGGQVSGAGVPEVTFLFTGHGSQYMHMGRELYQTQPVFRAVIDDCAERLRPYLEHSLLAALFPEPGQEYLMDGMAYTQPALFAVQIALAALWQSWGVEPTMVMGHSVGEYAAACVAGVFSLDDGLKLVAARGRLMEALPETGQMVAVFADEATVAAAVAPYAERVSIAVINGPQNIVISGAVEAVEAVLETLKQQKIKTRKLAVAQASHSPLIDPMLDEFEQVAATVQYHTPQIELVSCTTGQVAAPGEVTNAAYWRRHIRQPVRFATAIETLYAQGQRVFVEIGPHPTLLALGQRCLPDAAAAWIPSLREGVSDWTQVLESVGMLYVSGVTPDWGRFDADYPRRRLPLPTYPFQRARYWAEAAQFAPAASSAPVWQSVAAAVAHQSQRGPLDLALPTYGAKWDALDRLTTAHIIETLAMFGAFQQPGEVYTMDEFVVRFGIDSMYAALVRRWLKKLAALGWLEMQGDTFISRQPLPPSGLDAVWQETRLALADLPFMLTYLDRCSTRLAAILTGNESPLETLFPGGSFALAEDLYQNWSLSRYYGALMRAGVEAAVRTLPANRPLRVIEIGAGTGATTYAVLPALPPDRTTYTFTDVSDLFLAQAEQKFKAYPFVRYGLLDVEKTPETQGFARHSYDVVIATNVLHATRNLNETLQNVQALLAPGGLLLLDEATDHMPWFDMTTSLIAGWQRFEDDLRGDHPLLKPDQWEAVLRANGFGSVQAWPEHGAAAEILGQHVIVAQTAQMSYTESGTAVDADSKTFSQTEQAAPVGSAFVAQLEAALPDERHDLLVDYVRQRVARVLRLDANQPLDRYQRLLDMGLDSLMALELRTLLSGGLDMHEALPATLVFDYPTIDAIALYLEQTALGIGQTSPAPAEPAAADETKAARAAEIADLSDAEVEALLLKKLRR